MMAQAFKGDLSAGLYSWAHYLLPLVGNNKGYSPQSVNLILRFVETILSKPEARTILVNGAVRDGNRLIPPSSFEILVRLTFPASSARIEATQRFGAIYPLLKEVALAPGSNAVKQIFTFSLKLAGDLVLAKEAIAIAIRRMEGSSPSDTLTVNDTIYNFRIKNEKAIIEGESNCFLYKEAEESCKVILGKLSRGSGGLKITPITAMVIAITPIPSVDAGIHNKCNES